MTIIGTIRKKVVGITLIIFVGLMILLMVVSDIGKIFSFFTKEYTLQGDLIVGRVAGQPITYTEFQYCIDQHMHKNAKQQWDPEYRSYIPKAVWKGLVGSILYQQECNMANIKVGTSELIDIVQGEHIAPRIKLDSRFKDKETGQFDKQKIVAHLQKKVPHSKELQKEWLHIEQAVANQRCQEKLDLLLKKSSYKTTLERIQKEYLQETVLNLKYLYIPYATIQDEVVHVTDKQLIAYLQNHKDQYQRPQTRSIKYFNFFILPSMEDKKAFQEELQKLVMHFKTTQDPYAFAKDHTEADAASVACNFSASKLPEFLARVPNLQKDMVLGPVKTKNDLYKIYRIVAIKGTKNKKDELQYEVAVIEKKLMSSDITRDHIFKQVDSIAAQIKDIPTLKACAEKYHIKIEEATLTKDDVWVGGVPAREVVRWLYNDASIGSVSQIFEINDRYMVAAMYEENQTGLLPFSSIKEEIFRKVCNQEKAKIIVERLKKISLTNLEDIAAKYGKGVQIGVVNKLKFVQNEQNELNKIESAQNTIGRAFSLEQGQQSAPIVDERGVFLITLLAKNKVPIEKRKKEQWPPHIQEWLKQMKLKDNQKSMEEIGGVEDYLYKFY